MRSIPQLLWWVIPAAMIQLLIAGPYVMIGFSFGVGIIYAVRNFRSLLPAMVAGSLLVPSLVAASEPAGDPAEAEIYLEPPLFANGWGAG